MKHLIFIFTLLITFSISSDAQVTPICGYDFIMQKIKKNDAWYQNVQDVFERAKNHEHFYRSDDVFTLPVVVHVVWKEDEENIPDSLIYQQIEVLNENYRHVQPNADHIRPVFADIVEDPHIEFELQDIIRVHTDSTFSLDLFSEEMTLDNAKVTALGGSDAVDPQRTLNIWVIKIQPMDIFGQEYDLLLGFAYPPVGLPNWPPDAEIPDSSLDGVLINYKAFGRNNPYTLNMGTEEPIVLEGKTTVHEVGHYLGLRHIWGDAEFGSDGCAVDDGVNDTPNQASESAFDCDTTRNTCTEGADDLPDMIENYMDYSAESCMQGFTAGQINIMRSVIENERCGLIGCALDTKDNRTNREVYLSPNPVKTTVTIHAPSQTDIPVVIYSAVGKMVGKAIVRNHEIDVSGLPRGIYFIRMKIGNETVTRQLVKM